jgi:hypothetical protein
MPTYTNTSSALIQLINSGVMFGPNEVKEVYEYFDLTEDATGSIILSSHAPYWNPILSDSNVTGTNETKTVTLTTHEGSSVRVVYVSGNVTMFLNSTSNTPGMRIRESFILDNRGKIYRLLFTFVGAGEVQVQENL